MHRHVATTFARRRAYSSTQVSFTPATVGPLSKSKRPGEKNLLKLGTDEWDQQQDYLRDAYDTAVFQTNLRNGQEARSVADMARKLERAFPEAAFKKIGYDWSRVKAQRQKTDAGLQAHMEHLRKAREYILDLGADGAPEFMRDPLQAFREESATKTDAQLRQELKEESAKVNSGRNRWILNRDKLYADAEATFPETFQAIESLERSDAAGEDDDSFANMDEDLGESDVASRATSQPRRTWSSRSGAKAVSEPEKNIVKPLTLQEMLKRAKE